MAFALALKDGQDLGHVNNMRKVFHAEGMINAKTQRQGNVMFIGHFSCQ